MSTAPPSAIDPRSDIKPATQSVSRLDRATGTQPQWIYSLSSDVYRYDLLRPHRKALPLTGLGNANGLVVDNRRDVYEVNADEVGVFDARLDQPAKRTFTSADAYFAPYNIVTDSRRRVYVSGYERNTEDWSIQVFAPDASGVATPIREISGSATGIDSPNGLAVDSDGTVYVGNLYHKVLVFAPKASGNVPPFRIISGGLNYVENIALGADGNLYIACLLSGNKTNVVVFPKTANGNGTPLWTLNSGKYGYALALGQGGTIYLGPVSGAGPQRIAIFAPGASGDAKPIGFVGKAVEPPERLALSDPWFQP